MLANEQVVDGCCWQHETTQVEAKEIEQWFLRITQYADALLEGHGGAAGGWPERVLIHAAELDREIARRARAVSIVAGMDGLALEVFTTRMDTIYGVSAHSAVAGASGSGDACSKDVPGRAAMDEQLKAMRQKSMRAADIATAEKEGFFTGRFARESVFRRAACRSGWRILCWPNTERAR